jgi:hypothetical protein
LLFSRFNSTSYSIKPSCTALYRAIEDQEGAKKFFDDVEKLAKEKLYGAFHKQCGVIRLFGAVYKRST